MTSPPRRHLGRLIRRVLALLLLAVGFWLVPIDDLSSRLSSVWPLWSSLSTEERELVGVAVDALGVLIALLTFFYMIRSLRSQQRQQRVDKAQTSAGFPFKVFSSSDLEPLKVSMIGRHWDIPYVSRLPGRRQEQFRRRLQAGNLLLTGRTGLGKTREVIEAIEGLAKEKGEDVTVLVPEEQMDVPLAPPPDLPSRNIVVLINDIHQRYGPIESQDSPATAFMRDFHQRLSATIDALETRFAGSDLRFIFTARDEPSLRERLRLDSSPWANHRFDIFSIEGIHYTLMPGFVRRVAQHFKVILEDGAVEVVCRGSDGTPAGVVTSFASRGTGETLTVQKLANRSFTYPHSWYTEVYLDNIASNLRRKAVFEVLAALYRLRLPSYKPLVLKAAIRLWGRWPEFIGRGKVQATIDRDLTAWIFEFDNRIICPHAYLDVIDVSDEAMEAVTKTISRLLWHERARKTLIPELDNVVTAAAVRNVESALALEIMEAAAHAAPSRSGVWLSLARIRSLCDQEELAIQAAENAVSAEPRLPDAYSFLSLLYSRQGRDGEAIEAARLATSLAEDSGRAWLRYGIALSRARKHGEALDILGKARDLEPTNPKVFYSLAITYDNLDNLDDALSAARKALQLDPHNVLALRTLGTLLSRHGQVAEGVSTLEKARALEPESVGTLVALAQAYFAEGHVGKAEELLQEAEMRGAPSELASISMTCHFFGQPEQGIAAARKALQVEPNLLAAKRALATNLTDLGEEKANQESIALMQSVVAATGSAYDYYRLGVAYGKSNRHEQAIQTTRRALTLDPDLNDAKLSLAINLLSRGRTKALSEALQILENLVEAREQALDWSYLSRAYEESAQPEEGVAAARKALELDPQLTEAKYSLAVNLVQLDTPGSQAEAAKILTQLEAAANSASDWCYLSRLYSECNRPNQALKAAQQARELDPDMLEARRSLGISLTHLARPETLEEAIEHLKHVAEATSDARDQAWLSVAYGKAGLSEKAIVVAREALASVPDLIMARRSLGISLMRLNSLEANEEAVRHLEALAETTRQAVDLSYLSRAYKKIGRTEKAITVARKITELQSVSAGAQHALVRELNKLEDPDASVVILEILKHAAKTSGSATDWSILSGTYRRAGKAEEGVDAARTALELDPHLLEARWALASNLIRIRTREALEEAKDLLESLDETPEVGATWSFLATAFAELGLRNEAISAARKALELNGTLVYAKRTLAINLDLLGTHEARKEARLMAKEVAEESGEAGDWYRLGAAYGKSGNYQEGARCALVAINLDPGCNEAWQSLSINLGNLPTHKAKPILEEVLGSFGGNKSHLMAALKTDPTDKNLWRVAAWAFATTEHYEELVSTALKMMDSRDKTEGALIAVVEEFGNLNCPARLEALRLLSRITEVDDGNARYWNLKGVLQRKTRSADEAIRSHRRALAIDDGHPPFWYALGRAYEAKGEREEACDAYDRALVLNPSYAKARERYNNLCGQ